MATLAGKAGGGVRWIYRHGGKRLFDLSLSLAGFFFFALPILWIAWRVWRESGEPVLFRQVRVGFKGKNFSVWKFRTMTQDGIITRLGKSLRGTAIDELPQLLNILRGEMSFVGPRPLIPEELAALRQISDGERRLSLRPGLTGLAQLYTDKTPSPQERLRWDLSYADQCSPWLDAGLLLVSWGVTLRGAWERPGPRVPWQKGRPYGHLA